LNISKPCLLAAVLLSVSSAAFAQSADTKYCKALGASYETYVRSLTDQQRGAQPPTAAVSGAASKCDTAPGESIPVLEKALKDAKVALPPRA